MNEVTLKLITQEDLPIVWQGVLDGLKASSNYGGWTGDEARTIIENNMASLHLWYVDGEYAGSIILMKITSKVRSHTLHIFSIYIKPEYGVFIDANMYQVDAIAKKHGCGRITFQSTRYGWEKRAKRLGFTPKTVIYEKEV